MKKLLISTLLSLLCLLFIFVSCTSSESGNQSQTTADVDEITGESAEFSSEELTSEIGETTEEETTAEDVRIIYASKDEIKFRWYHVNADFFDYRMLYRAKDEDFEKLQKGMTYSEVIEIVGRPHGMWGSGKYIPHWYSLEGYHYMMYFEEPYDENGEYIITHSIYEYADLATFSSFDKYGRFNIASPKPGYTGTDIKERFEDPRLKELPSYDDLMNLPRGMTYKEVIELYGNPQYYGYGTFAGITRLLHVFYTAEGIEVAIQFDSGGNSSLEVIYRRVNYIISLDPQNYIPGRDSFETVIVTTAPSTNTATPETTAPPETTTAAP